MNTAKGRKPGTLAERLSAVLRPFASLLFFLNLVPSALAQKTVQDRVQEYGAAAAQRWAPFFKRAEISYPPRAITFIGLKQEKLLEVWAAGTKGSFRFIRSYPILAASGKLGPKLRQGDKQVPEGLYRIESLNPNSSYHLSLRVNYPNEDDRERAKAEGRTNLGGDIMIHGRAVSIGCLAMGDEAAEDLFVFGGPYGRGKYPGYPQPGRFSHPRFATASRRCAAVDGGQVCRGKRGYR
jgi:hypothetical protein